MGVARAAAELRGTVAEVERRWAEPEGWPAFVDGFGHVVELDPAWPAVGARLVWESVAGGRGRVVEKVLRHEPGAELVTEVEDPQLSGMQRLAYGASAPAALTGHVDVELELEYALAGRGPLMLLADPLFVRRALRDSLRRTLERLGSELGG